MPGALVVNADDLGVARGATLGIVRAHREGIVTSASLAVTTPAYDHALETCVRVCPEIGLGLHFTLTSGRPVSPAAEVPLLVDRGGFFRWRFLPLLLATTRRRGSQPLVGQIAAELERQLDRLEADGIRPDHIDGERHVHLVPAVFDLVAAAAVRRGIRFVRLGRDIGWRHFSAAQLPAIAVSGGVVKSWLLSRLSARARGRLPAGLRYAEHLASYLYTGRLDQVLPALLAAGDPGGVTEIMVHPGVPEASAPPGLGNRELERYLASAGRQRELAACIAARRQIPGGRLTTFRRLAEGA